MNLSRFHHCPRKREASRTLTSSSDWTTIRIYGQISQASFSFVTSLPVLRACRTVVKIFAPENVNDSICSADSSNRVLLRVSKSDFRRTRIPRSHEKQNSSPLKDRTSRPRQRTAKTALVESAFFVDESLYEHIGRMFPHNPRKNVYIFALTLVNQLQIAYEQEPLKGMVQISLAYLEIMHPQPKASMQH